MFENTACGEHLAEVTANRVVVTEAGKINVEVCFKFPSGDTGWKTLYSHTEKALQQMVKTLSVLGFKLKTEKHPDGKLLEDLGDNLLAGKKAVVTVEENEYPPGSGKIKKQISWVNIAKEKPKPEHFQAFQAKLNKVNLEDDFS